MKKLVMAVIAAAVFAVSASAFDAVHGQEYYTVKVKVATECNAVKCDVICDMLLKDGIMSFCGEQGGLHVTMAGIYETEKEAADAALAIHNKYNIVCKVAKTQAVAAAPYMGGLLVNVPSGIWLKKGGTDKEIFAYGKCCDAREMIIENKVAISPDGKEMAFYYNGAIHKVGINNGRDTVLVGSLSNPGLPCRPDPKWSPDGKMIAFMEEYGTGKGAGIRLIKSDGSGDVCLLNNRNSGMHVASFEWHPAKNEIYFVASDAGKRVPIDGKLCLLSLDGKVKDVIAPAAGKEIDRHFKIQGNKLIISENTYRPGMDDNYSSQEKTIELN